MARSEAIRMSQASAVSKPPASAQPLTAPTIGFGIRCMPRVKPFRPSSTISRMSSGPASRMIGGMYSFRSAPAQKASSPAPVRMATSTESSSAKSAQAAIIALCTSGLTALRASGRLIVT